MGGLRVADLGLQTLHGCAQARASRAALGELGRQLVAAAITKPASSAASAAAASEVRLALFDALAESFVPSTAITPTCTSPARAHSRKTAVNSSPSACGQHGRGGFRTCDLSRVSSSSGAVALAYSPVSAGGGKSSAPRSANPTGTSQSGVTTTSLRGTTLSVSRRSRLSRRPCCDATFGVGDGGEVMRLSYRRWEPSLERAPETTE